MLSKLGSSREAIPPDVAIDHLQKPSIKPSKESESIFVPPKPQPDVVPMDVENSKGKNVLADLGTVRSDPGIS